MSTLPFNSKFIEPFEEYSCGHRIKPDIVDWDNLRKNFPCPACRKAKYKEYLEQIADFPKPVKEYMEDILDAWLEIGEFNIPKMLKDFEKYFEKACIFLKNFFKFREKLSITFRANGKPVILFDGKELEESFLHFLNANKYLLFSVVFGINMEDFWFVLQEKVHEAAEKMKKFGNGCDEILYASKIVCRNCGHASPTLDKHFNDKEAIKNIAEDDVRCPKCNKKIEYGKRYRTVFLDEEIKTKSMENEIFRLKYKEREIFFQEYCGDIMLIKGRPSTKVLELKLKISDEEKRYIEFFRTIDEILDFYIGEKHNDIQKNTRFRINSWANVP